jgi:TonB-dependent receptor
MNKLFTASCTVALLLAFSNSILAQSPSRIAGKITDQTTGEPLTGVTVLVSKTTQGAVTDVDGTFLISGLQPGSYTVNFNYLGYQKKTVTHVKVEAGRAAVLNTVLSRDTANRLNEVVITSSYRQQSINALYIHRKNAGLVSDGITADQITKSPDKNTAEVLQRISGTTVQDDKFVVIRGLAARYNSTMMNGTTMPATEPDQRAFAFNVIPSSLVDNIVIYKTASPDHPGDATGGTVNINTKDMPDRKIMSLSLGTGYNTQTALKDFYTGYGNGKYDFLGFDDGSRALPGAFKAAESGYAALSTAAKMDITRKFSNTFGGQNDGMSLLPLSFQLTAGNTYPVGKGNKIGIIGSLSYRNNHQSSDGEQDQYLLSKEHEYHYNDSHYRRTYNTGALLNAAYTFGNNKLSWKNFFSNEFAHVFTKRTGQIFDGNSNTKNIFSINNETTQNGLLNSILVGKHILGNKAVHISWDLAYGLSYRKQPDQRILTVMQSSPGEAYYLSLSNENSPAIKDAGRVYSHLHENIYSGNLRVEVPFHYFRKGQKLKFGLSKVYRDRGFSILALGYASDLDPYGRGATVTLSKNTTLSDIFSLENIEKYKILLANIPQNSNNYAGTADLNAGYLMLDNHFSSSWRLSWGIRLEDYRQKLASLNQPVQKYHYLTLLPAANLTWSPDSKMNIRLAYSQTVNRPEFRELASFRYYDYQHNYIISGNPQLKQSTENNADWRIEYYPGIGEIMSASVFYKYFHHPIERINQGNNVLTYSNADKAIDYGVELELRKNLGFIGGWPLADNFTVYGNASFIRSHITFSGEDFNSTLQGQAPYMVNGGLNYSTSKKDLSFTVLYNTIGPRLQFRGENEGLDADEKPRQVVDLQIGKKIFKQAGEIRFTVSDIFAQPTVLYYKYNKNSKSRYDPATDKTISSFRYGTTLSISFKYSFAH